MEPKPDLIYDVGMHNGADTAYYLHKGFRVVAIEANPFLVQAGEARFSAEIAAGRLQILAVGVAAQRGEAEFYVSTEVDEWSSFDREIATRQGRACQAVRVPCLPFGDIIAEHGVPFYCKIDIEGADRICLSGLTPSTSPPHISVEMSHQEGDDDIRFLMALGYTRFQCVRQNDLVPMHPGNIDSQSAARRVREGAWPRALPSLVARRLKKMFRPPRDGNWVFRPGTSGPFADFLTGPWLSAEQILDIWTRLHDIDIELDAHGLGEWFDIHAAR